MREIPSGSVDLIICDPPYGTIKGIGKSTDKFNKDTTWDVVIPTIDKDRTTRGDVFKKPTAYWFVNIKPTHTHTHTHQQTPKSKIRKICNTKSGERAGLCSEARSMISQDYARNFICDFILGKRQAFTDLELFND